MPFGDRTGPRGMGPMTGRGGGQCAMAWPAGGCRFHVSGVRRSGGGRGWRHWYRATGLAGWVRARKGRFGDPRYAPWTPQEELQYLKEYIQGLEEALNATRARKAEIEKSVKAE